MSVDLLNLPDDLLERILLIHFPNVTFTLLQGVSKYLLTKARQIVRRLRDKANFYKMTVLIRIEEQLRSAEKTQQLGVEFIGDDITWFICTPAFVLRVQRG